MIAENLETVTKYFGDDMNASRLSNQLAVLSEAISDVIVKMKDVVSSTLTFTSNCNIFSDSGKLLQLMYVLPVATASAERSFSSLRRLKTYFRTTNSTQRLNHLMHLPVHRNCTERLNVQKIASEFVSRNQKRQIGLERCNVCLLMFFFVY